MKTKCAFCKDKEVCLLEDKKDGYAFDKEGFMTCSSQNIFCDDCEYVQTKTCEGCKEQDLYKEKQFKTSIQNWW